MSREKEPEGHNFKSMFHNGVTEGENTLQSVRDAQINAGEEAVLQSLKKKGLLERQLEDDMLEKEKWRFPLGNQPTSEQGLNQPLKGKPSTAKVDEGSANFERSKEMTLEEKLASLAELGNRFNQGKLPWHLVDFRALEPMVQVLNYGAKKYAVDQWKNGLSKKETLDSLIRHLVALYAGEERDPESGELHIGHLMCNALFYSYFTTVDSSNSRP